MNRKIKFRAWDIKRNNWFSEGFSVCESGTQIFDGDEFAYNIGEDVQLMQYTGLKDKNGNDIYEGDILSVDYPLAYHFEEDFINITVVIDFHGGAFWFTGGGYTDCNWHFYNESEREIIGNIYQHPELLK